ncbi:MAG: hypothetical protein U0401_32835 [Anaerolineae bacterium]
MGTLFEGYHPRMEAVHRHNAARLREIIAAQAGQGSDLSAQAAWRIVQHAIGGRPFSANALNGCKPPLPPEMSLPGRQL